MVDKRPFGSCVIGRIKPKVIILESENKGHIKLDGREVIKEDNRWFYIIQ